MRNAISLVQDLNSCRRVHFPTTITITPRQPVNMIMIYHWNKKLHVSWSEFIFVLDSVWVQIKILLQDSLQRCTWKTKFLGTPSEGLFWTPSDRISHSIHIVRTSCSQLPTDLGFYCLLVKVFYWPYGLKFVYPTINLVFLGITVKVKLAAKFCLHSFEWFLSPNK